ncbi:MAG: hypothetical protein IPO81_09505 [Kouleothrix sp.]|nr:hypothetical protein [Kouleothrix sp.]
MGHLYIDRDLGRIFAPAAVGRLISRPGAPVKKAHGEIGVFVTKQHRRPIVDLVERGGVLVPVYGTLALIWASITHNERVDAGAQKQALQTFGGGGTPGAPSATVYFNVIAHASATLTKTKTDQSLGSASSGVTTNEFTTIGMSRAAATLVGGNYRPEHAGRHVSADHHQAVHGERQWHGLRRRRLRLDHGGRLGPYTSKTTIPARPCSSRATC